MVYPSGSRGLTDGLERELARRMRFGEPLFEYYAPMFVETREVDGRICSSNKALLFNYFFIHASESEIYRLKKNEEQYNFLPRVNEKDGGYHYPYISDEEMRNFKWVVRSYSGQVPLCSIDPAYLVKGDRIRITKGRFKGVEATVMSRPGSGQKEFMVLMDRWLSVPLLKVHEGEYEVINLAAGSKNADKPLTYTKLDNEKIINGLHEALCRYHREETTAEDRRMAEEILREYSDMTVNSNVLRAKLYALLLTACTILNDVERTEGLKKLIQLMLPSVTAGQSAALLYVSLYGCTDNSVYYDMAHGITDAWRLEPSPKKNKQLLLKRLEDYDRVLGHAKKDLHTVEK